MKSFKPCAALILLEYAASALVSWASAAATPIIDLAHFYQVTWAQLIVHTPIIFSARVRGSSTSS